MDESRAFAKGAPRQVQQLYFARRLARRAVACRIRKYNLLAEHAHGFRGGTSLNNFLLSRLLSWCDWRGTRRLIGRYCRRGDLHNRGRRRTGGVVLGRVDENNEQKPDSQTDANHPFAASMPRDPGEFVLPTRRSGLRTSWRCRCRLRLCHPTVRTQLLPARSDCRPACPTAWPSIWTGLTPATSPR